MADPAPLPDPLPPPLKKRRARPWHRVLGILTILPLAWVTVTGALLNHTVDWDLDTLQIEHPWVLRAYGMSPSGEPAGLRIGPHEVAAWDGQVFFNAVPLEISGPLVGAAADGDGVAVVTRTEVLRLDASGVVIESLDGASLPDPPLLGVAGRDGRVLLQNAGGWHVAEGDWLEFSPAADASPVPLGPVDDAETLRRAWAQGGLPASRVLLDLHAAKFLGAFSKYFYDLVAVCTLWLCVTGAILFFRKPRRNR